VKLQTNIALKKQSENGIDYNSFVVLLGSCFSENIGKKLDYFKFKNLHNPLGILFQPTAIEALLKNAVNKKKYKDQDVFFHNEQWHCFDAHSKLSKEIKNDLIISLNERVLTAHTKLIKASHIVITLGSAWVYRHIESNKLVANCHKVPQKKFSKELRSVQDIVCSLKSMVDQVRRINKEATIIFTVSPIRHLRDGFVENTQSKAHLIAAVHQVVETVTNVYYFPSYEIMMDELRDYRFYEQDMVHPNQLALDCIWDKFKTVWVSRQTETVMKEIEAIQKALAHKPFNANGAQYSEFLKQTQQRINELEINNPNLQF
jgi:hypothetical protein